MEGNILFIAQDCETGSYLMTVGIKSVNGNLLTASVTLSDTFALHQNRRIPFNPNPLLLNR
jgi:hypothetical protein